MAKEPDASGSSMAFGSASGTISSGGKGNLFNKQKESKINMNFSMEIPGLTNLAKEFQTVTGALNDFKAALNSLASSQSILGNNIATVMTSLQNQAKKTTAAITDMSDAMNGVSGGKGKAGKGGGGGSKDIAPIETGNGNSDGGKAAISKSGLRQAALGGAITGAAEGSSSISGAIGGAISGATYGAANAYDPSGTLSGLLTLAGNLAVMPMNFVRTTMETNRANTIGASQELTPYAFATGQSNQRLMKYLGTRPGGMMGNIGDYLTAMSQGGVAGMYNNGTGANSSENYFKNIGLLQKMTPGLGAGAVGGMLTGQYTNTSSTQRGAFYTSGAFSMVKQGGGMKSVEEWAASILKWMETQRPGDKRGKAFTHGELLSQNFPGSNFNAWFDSMGVTPEMKNYFWTYALAKVSATESGTELFGNMKNNLAYNKAKADSLASAGQLTLGSKMSPVYNTREKANQGFNSLMNTITNNVLPAIAGPRTPLGALSYLPDPIANFLYSLIQQSGPVGQILGGLGFDAAGWLGTATSLGGNAGRDGGVAAGDIGDPGYGAYGAQSTAGLAPDLRPKVDAMLKANPKLRVTSGLRDSFTQSKLKGKGIGHFNAQGTSQHVGGWAADIGPRSQYKWIQANARKFGLDHGSKYGEPWHVQVAGTMSPSRLPGYSAGDIGDMGGDSSHGDVGFLGLPGVGSIIKDLKMMAKLFMGIFKMFSTVGDAFSAFTSLLSGGGDVQSKFDKIIPAFLGATLGPLGGEGRSDQSIDISSAMDSTAATSPGIQGPTGDIGDYGYAQSSSRYGDTTVHFHNNITIPVSSVGPTSTIDLKRVTSQLADQLESEMKKRLARSR